MQRTGWSAVLTVSVVALVVGAGGLFRASDEQEVGTIEPGALAAAAAETSTAQGYADPAGTDARPGLPTSPPAQQPALDRESAATSEVARRPTGPSAAQQQPPMAPARLRVASVGLHAPVDAVGVRDDGLMQIPDDGSRVGWYRYGPSAGDDAGSVVLAGHVDTSAGLGAMAALRDVTLGSTVEVELADGSILTYEVIGRRRVPKDALQLDALFDRAGPARLTLITCGGPWRPEAGSYRDNVVVVALPSDQG